jgi:DnaJ-class molecular chaperone
MVKNYYLILGITANANREDIKAAFRRRALELHPDRSGLGSGPFQDVQEAYSVLGDPESRRRYDREYQPIALRRPRSAPAAEPLVTQRPKGEPFRVVEPARTFREFSVAKSLESYRPSIDEFFDHLWSNFEDVSRPKSEGLESLTIEVFLNPDEAAYGGRVRVWIPTRAACGACGGRGSVGLYECWRCGGHGALTTEFPLGLDYHPGLRDGYAFRIPLKRLGIENLFLTVLFRVTEGTFNRENCL